MVFNYIINLCSDTTLLLNVVLVTSQFSTVHNNNMYIWIVLVYCWCWECVLRIKHPTAATICKIKCAYTLMIKFYTSCMTYRFITLKNIKQGNNSQDKIGPTQFLYDLILGWRIFYMPSMNVLFYHRNWISLVRFKNSWLTRDYSMRS